MQNEAWWDPMEGSVADHSNENEEMRRRWLPPIRRVINTRGTVCLHPGELGLFLVPPSILGGCTVHKFGVMHTVRRSMEVCVGRTSSAIQQMEIEHQNHPNWHSLTLS